MTIDVDTAGPVMTITLADEAERNSLRPEMVEALRSALVAANRDDSVRVVVVTNTGNVFCAGADLRHQSSDAGRTSGRVGGGLELLLCEMLDSPTPIVGRIAGHALGGGVGLAAACDVSVAIDTIRFGFTEVRLGLSPAIISVVCLPKMRRGDAREVFLRGNQFSAARAAELGLVNRAVPAVDLDGTVAEIVGDVVAGGPSALHASKRLLAQVPALSRDDAFAWAADLSAELFASSEGLEGMAAFLEKRAPAWAPDSS